MEKIQYKGWTIEDDDTSYIPGDMIAYPTTEGIQHDGDVDGEGHFKYAGNCLFGCSVEDLKDRIDEKIMALYPIWQVGTGKRRVLHITKFEWLSDAVKFAATRNGTFLNYNFLNP